MTETVTQSSSSPVPAAEDAAWLQALAAACGPRVQSCTSQPAAGGTRLDIRFAWRDMGDNPRSGRARIYLPASVTPVTTDRLPVHFVCAYPLDEKYAENHLTKDFLVVTSDLPEPEESWPGPHPLERGANLDVALLHLARALPWTDLSRLVISGGSAGGWLALLCAAESFPAAMCTPDVPIVNWAYNATYHVQNSKLAKLPAPEGAVRLGVFTDFTITLDTAAKALGEDTAGAAWFALSPVAHADEITCPVTAVCTTADVLVPIDQVATGLAQESDPADFPENFMHDPGDLGPEPTLGVRLLDVLDPSSVTLERLAVPEGSLRLDVVREEPHEDAFTRVQLPHGPTQWNIGVIDEGAPDGKSNLRHYKYAVHSGRDGAYRDYLSGAIPAEQLTAAKLRRLVARWRGDGWLPNGLRSLDEPDYERLDVREGLATYAEDSTCVQRLQSLYAQLDPADQVFGDLAQASPSDVPALLRRLS